MQPAHLGRQADRFIQFTQCASPIVYQHNPLKESRVLGRRRCQPVDLFYATAASKFSVVTFQLEAPRVVSRSRGHAWLPSLPATVVWPIETVPCALTCSSHSFLSHQAHQLTSLFPRNCRVGFRSFHLCVSHPCGSLGYGKALACAFVKSEATQTALLSVLPSPHFLSQ